MRMVQTCIKVINELMMERNTKKLEGIPRKPVQSVQLRWHCIRKRRTWGGTNDAWRGNEMEYETTDKPECLKDPHRALEEGWCGNINDHSKSLPTNMEQSTMGQKLEKIQILKKGVLSPN